ncbi:MAG: hypothetical protein A3F13_05465 [Gammaproteobacteria bacterium RIFCSPHIGHO2_12_FULL_40_19]|nr:MAG: hypothetical protein A3F13_05465 [Gammaproteobacteria bacterium RIFCSPHIGHO2_12_FULL_40_19]
MSRIPVPSRTTVGAIAALTFSSIALYLYKNDKLSTMTNAFDTRKLLAFFFPATAKHIEKLEKKVEQCEKQLRAQSAEVASPTAPTLFCKPGTKHKPNFSGSDVSEFDDAAIDPQVRSPQGPSASAIPAPTIPAPWYSRLNPLW